MMKTKNLVLHHFSPFQSFWMGGYECSDKLNAFGERVDLLKATQHLEQLENDYELLSPFGIKTVREGIRWSRVEQAPYIYDWGDVAQMIKVGEDAGIQQVWDLCHFGFPDDLTPLHPMFARRFASLCKSFVVFYRSIKPYGKLIVTPINEVSFLSWLGGDVRGTSPYCINLGWEVKYALMRAYIEGVAAMKEMDNHIIILCTEPLVNIVPSCTADLQSIAAAVKADEEQFQAIDMLMGRQCPELGGKPAYLDMIGCNFYHHNQWELGSLECLPWANEHNDSRWLSFAAIFKKVFNRYDLPCILAETSHPGEDRPQWIRYIASECAALITEGFPLLGICIYPLIGRPDWDNLSYWHTSGIWDAVHLNDGTIKRVLYDDYANAIIEAQATIQQALSIRQLCFTDYYSKAVSNAFP